MAGISRDGRFSKGQSRPARGHLLQGGSFTLIQGLVVLQGLRDSFCGALHWFSLLCIPAVWHHGGGQGNSLGSLPKLFPQIQKRFQVLDLNPDTVASLYASTPRLCLEAPLAEVWHQAWSFLCGIFLYTVRKLCCCDWLNNEADWSMAGQDTVRQESLTE